MKAYDTYEDTDEDTYDSTSLHQMLSQSPDSPDSPDSRTPPLASPWVPCLIACDIQVNRSICHLIGTYWMDFKVLAYLHEDR